MRRGARRRIALAALLLSTGLGAARCDELFPDPAQPLLYLDWLVAGEVAEIVPGAPLQLPGPDLELGTADDVFPRDRIGDVDLVIRSGRTTTGAAFPAPNAPGTEPDVAVAPLSGGTPIDFVVAPSTWALLPDLGIPTVSPNLVGVPIVVAAFPDLDGDGYVGITSLDGDPLDVALEQAELVPVAQTLVVSDGGEAAGQLFPSAGGPAGAPLRLLLTAAAWVGVLDPAFQNGVVADGPLQSTRLPFHPESDPAQVLEGGAGGPSPAVPNGALGAEIKPAFDPDPAHPLLGESFSLPTDGSEPTTDLATARSGSVSRIGLARLPDLASFDDLPSRPLRPGLDAQGGRIVLEVLQRLPLEDDGPASQALLQVVPVDLLGNVADVSQPRMVALRVEGPLAITSPDSDADPSQEVIFIVDAAGVEILVDDLGSAFDGPNRGVVHLQDDQGGVSRTPVFLPDPDVDDSGQVGPADVATVEASSGLRDGDPGFDPDLDLTGDGRIGDDDVAVVEAAQGQLVAIP